MLNSPTAFLATAIALLVGSLTTEAVGQKSTLVRDVELCNAPSSTGPDSRIAGCSALIKAHSDSPRVAAIAFHKRGLAYAEKGEYAQAIGDYDSAIKLNSSDPALFNDRGVAHEKKGELARAIQDFSAAISLDQSYATAVINRADAYEKAGDHVRSLADLDTAIRLQPSSALLNDRCWLRALTGALDAALADCNESIRLDPKMGGRFDSRGFVQLKLGHWELAIADYTSALELQPTLASALYGRGLAKLKLGDVSGNSDVAAATRLQPKLPAEFATYGIR